MSDLLFTDRESEQRRLDLALAEPRERFDLGYVGQRAGEGLLAAGARLAEGVMGPGLEWIGRSGRELSEFGSDITGGLSDSDADFWSGVERRAQEGMERARVERRYLEAGDPERQSWASELVFGVTQMLSLGALGASGASALGAGAGLTGWGLRGVSALGSASALGPSYGVPTYADFIDEGVDEETAFNAALIEGGSMAALGALPVSVPGNLLTRITTGVGINVPFGAAYRGSMESYLRSQGYEEQASRYRWNDAQMLVTDAVLGAVFGGLFGGRAGGAVARPRGGEGEARGEADAPAGPRDGEWYFEEARQLANDGDLRAAYAHAFIAHEMGYGEAQGLMDAIVDEGGAEVAADGQAQAGAMLLRDGLLEPPQELIDAAMTLEAQRRRDVESAPGVPLDLDAQARHAESMARAERQFAEGEEIDVGDLWREDAALEGFAPHPDDIEAMAAEIEYARAALADAPSTLTEFVRRQGEVRDERGRVIQRGGIRDDRGDVAGGAGDARRGFASLLSPTGRTLDDIALAAWEEGYFPDLQERPTTRELIDALDEEARGLRTFAADEAAAFAARNARDILSHYESRGVDTTLTGQTLRDAVSPLARRADAEAAMRQILNEEGFSEMAREVEDLRARIREMGGELGPDDMMFSRRGEAEFVAPRNMAMEERAANGLRTWAQPPRRGAPDAHAYEMERRQFIERMIEFGERDRIKIAQAVRERFGGDPSNTRSVVSRVAERLRVPLRVAPAGRQPRIDVGALIREAGKPGATYRSVGEVVGASADRVRVLLAEQGVHLERSLTGKEARNAQIEALRAQGLAQIEIAAQLGVTRSTVAGVLKRARERAAAEAEAPRPVDSDEAAAQRLGMSVEKYRRLSARSSDARYSLTETGGFSTVEGLIARAEAELGADWTALAQAGRVEVVQHSRDVPAGLLGLPRGVQAVHMRDTRTTYFIANNIRPEHLKGLVLHEIGVHHGMEGMLGKRGFRELMRQVERMVEEEHPGLVEARAFAERYAARPEHVPEETVAYLIETHADLPIVNRILAHIRQWLIKTFGTTFGMRLTVDDIRQLAVDSLRRVAEQARREAADVTPVAWREGMDEALSPEEAQAVMASAREQGYQGSDTGEAVEWLNAIAKGLPMDEASRMGRAREMGFDVDTPLYHGTGRDIAELRAGTVDTVGGGMRGRNLDGVWLTNRPFDASGYAEQAARKTQFEQTTQRFLQEKDALNARQRAGEIDQADWERELRELNRRYYGDGGPNSFYESDAATEGANVMPLRARLRNPLVIDARRLRPASSEEATLGGADPEMRGLPRINGRQFTRMWELRRYAEEAGHDGIIFRNFADGPAGGRSDNYLVFDPTNIRSRFAAFDPANEGSANLLASIRDNRPDAPRIGKGGMRIAAPRPFRQSLVGGSADLMEAARLRQEAYDKLSPAWQALMDEPDMMFSVSRSRTFGRKPKRVNLPHPFVGAADVTINPTRADIADLLSAQRARDVQSVRWGITPEGDLLVWDGTAAMHAMVSESAGSRFIRHGEIEDALEIDAVLSTAQKARTGELSEYNPRQVAEELGISVETAERMLVRHGRVRARDVMRAVEAEAQTAREMKKGYDAAVRCAIRHGGASWVTLGGASARAGATAAAGQALGLTAALPLTIAGAPLLARQADPEGYARRRLQALEGDAMEGARALGEMAGLDAPSPEIEAPAQGEALSDVVGTEQQPFPIGPGGIVDPEMYSDAPPVSEGYVKPGQAVPPDAPGAEPGQGEDAAAMIEMFDELLNPDGEGEE